MGRCMLMTAYVLPGDDFVAYPWEMESIAFLMSEPVCCQSPCRALASRWNPVLKSGIFNRVWPVISKADAKPFKKVGSFKFKILLYLSILSIITKFQALFNYYLSAFLRGGLLAFWLRPLVGGGGGYP